MNLMRKALIVGIDNYPESQLLGCVNDANRISDILAKNEDGSPNFSCKKLTASNHEQLIITKAYLKKHTDDLFSNDVDIALFYFSGHGTEKNLGGFLVTQDSKEYDEGVAMVEILTLANNSKAREVVIILDCCNSGFMGSLPIIDNNAVLREGMSILTASKSYQFAVEINGNGVFTSLVCSALEGGASDVTGQITIAGVYAYVDQSLGPWEQRPLFKSHVSTLNCLRKCNPKIEPSVLRLLPQYFSHPDFVYPLDPSYEPSEEPSSPNNEKIFGHLQEYCSAGLLIPVGEKHMYYAAMRGESCKLTPLGKFYWNRAKGDRI